LTGYWNENGNEMVWSLTVLSIKKSSITRDSSGLTENIFLKEKFNGNGRSCGTCHVESNNFTIDPEFISTMPRTDPLPLGRRWPIRQLCRRPTGIESRHHFNGIPVQEEHMALLGCVRERLKFR
jgi:hypothetical protein